MDDNETDNVTAVSGKEPSPGEEVIEPVIVPTTAAEASTIFDPTRPANHKKQPHDGVLDMSKYVAGFTDANHENALWSGEGVGAKIGTGSPQSRPNSAQSHKKHSQPALSINDETVGDDGFPWNPSPRGSHISIDMDATSVTMYHDMRRASRASIAATAVENADKTKNFLWWRRLVKTLEDNRVQTQDAMQKLLLLEKTQDKHFRWLKKIMNMVFLVAGLLLLLAVIVLIIYTDPQFNESMKALTVFLAGRRQGLW